MRNDHSLPRPRRRGVMRALAQARPPRLDAAAGQTLGWPDASAFTGAAGGPEPAAPPSAGRRRGRKLVAALCSAAATGAAIGIVLAAGAGLPWARHATGPGRGPAAAAPISFRDLPLAGGWTGRLAYGVRNGVVYLAGTVGDHGAGAAPVTTLPRAIRPGRTVDLTANLGRHGFAVIQVAPDGQVTLVFPRGLRGYRFVSLDGVRYPLGVR